jgi:hypothetical protein
MRHKVLHLVILLFLPICSAFAQNPFPNGLDFYHWGDDGQVFGIKGEEFGISPDTTFYNFIPYAKDTFVYECEFSPGCYINNISPAMGMECFSIVENDWTFITEGQDSLRFLFDESANGPTTIYQNETTTYTLVFGGFETTNFLGVDDVVNLYSIVAFDDIDQTVTGEYEFIIRIGEETGLHQMVDLRLFLTEMETFEVAGSDVFTEGFKPMKWSDAYDFQPGDVCQYRTETNSGGGAWETYRLDSIVSRTDYPDSVLYHIQRVHHFGYADPSIYEWVWTTTVSEIEVVYPHSIIIHSPSNHSINGLKGTNQWEEFDGTSQWGLNTSHKQASECIADIFCTQPEGSNFNNIHYLAGLGHVGSHSGSTGANTYGSLIYYNKQGEVYGDQFYLGIENQEILPIHIFPNPAKDHISISLTSSELIHVRILNMKGQCCLLTTTTGQPNFQLDISLLTQGIYIIEIELNSNLYRQKLIVQR